MESREIKQKVLELRQYYGQAEPAKLATNLGVEIIFSSNLQTVLGMYSQVNNFPFIFINQKLDDNVQKLVLAHELGHAILHTQTLKQDVFTTNDFFKLNQKLLVTYEHEANLFAAFLLINVPELNELLQHGLSLNEIANALAVCPELLMYYCRIIQKEPDLCPELNLTITLSNKFQDFTQTVDFWQNYCKH